MTTPVAPPTGEPALILAVISSAVGLLVTLNVSGLTPATGGLIVALAAAIGALATAFFTRPISPSIFSGVVTATFALLAGYHFNVSPGTIGEINGLLTALLMLIVRGHVTPVITAKGTRV